MLLAGVVLPADAYAQDAQSSENSGVGDIVVTARKSNETLTDVPIAITALTSEALEARGITDVADLAAFTPGFRFQNQSVGRNDRGFKQYNMRGLVPNNASSVRQNVTIFVDGAPVGGGNVAGIGDVERVEVVKGPQSAFFGRGTFAGAVNFITREPSYDWKGTVSAQYERFNSSDLNASIEGAIIPDKLAFRISGRAYHTDGQYHDSTYSDTRLGRRNTKSISLSLLAQPTDNLKIRFFGVYWNDSDGLPANARYGQSDYNCNAGAGIGGADNYICGKLGGIPMASATWAQYIEPTAYAALQNGTLLHKKGFMDHLGLERDAKQFRLSADWDVAGLTVSAIGAYSDNNWGFLQTQFGSDLRSIPNTSATAANGRLDYVYSLTEGNTKDEDKYVELRVATDQSAPFKLLGGVNYQNLAYTNMTTAYGTTGYVVATPIGISEANTYSIFGSASYDITDQLSVSAEGRYQIDKQSQTTVSTTTSSLKHTFKAFTPRFIVQYKPDDRSSVYASYSRGNRAGAFNSVYYAQSDFVKAQIDAASPVQGVIPEEKLWMAEVGYKAQLFDNRVRLLAAAYYGKWTDRGIPSTIPVYTTLAAQATGVTDGSVVITAPGGKVKVQGIELETAFKATDNLLLEGTFNIADTKILNTYSSDAFALTGNGTPYGTQLPFYPKMTGTASATYTRQIGIFDAYLRGDMIYTGKQYETEANLAYTAPAATVNVRLGASWDGKRVELFATNILNNKTPTSLARTTYATYTAAGVGTTRNAITVSLPDRPSYGIKVSSTF
ncbi:TonB-dependent receptor [Novosphingobium sp. BL-52-GroH]|uniref:TonB-dependent receptor n=1 Tax=Novosphingobium sp. BL-52-GroH TaxID=3349877 RepID=UPI00384E8A4A